MNKTMSPEELYLKLVSTLNKVQWSYQEMTKAIHRLERKQEKLRNFIKELKND